MSPKLCRILFPYCALMVEPLRFECARHYRWRWHPPGESSSHGIPPPHFMLSSSLGALCLVLTLFITSEALSGMLARRKVAIIGAGPAGLVTSKQLMDMGVVAKIFSNNIGGMWNAQANPFWPAMKTNLSKYTCRFSDHAWPEKTQVFPTQQEMQGYLNEYAAKHVHPENIVLNCKVTRVHTEADGRFNLVWDDATGKNNCELFDDVVVATGFFSKPSVPGDFSSFKGRVMHSSEYTSPEAFAGRNVVVVGSSFSSAEIAADVATTASSVRNVVPRPSWMIPRFLPVETDRADTAFLPVDLMFYQLSRKRDGESRTEALFKKDADRAKTNGYLRSLVGGDAQDVMQQLRQEEAAAHAGTVPSVHSSISDNYSNMVRAGLVKILQGYVRSGNGNALHLTQEKDSSHSAPTTATLGEVSDVIMCTGFTPALDFLDGRLRETLGLAAGPDALQPLLLHRDVMHPAVPGLYFVGMYRGPYFAVVELQARAVASYISGRLAKPSEETMQRGVAVSQQIRAQQPRPQFPHADYVGLSYDWMRELGLPLPFSSTAEVSAPATQIFTPCMIASSRATDAGAGVDETAVQIQRTVEECNAGRYLSQTIFRALQGDWEFERSLLSRLDIAPSGTVTGRISFARCDRGNPDLMYTEKGVFTTTKGLVMDVNGTQYVYALNEEEDCIDVYFADKATGKERERIFVSLKVAGRDEGGWLAVGEPHLCGEDTYKVSFKLAFQGLALKSVLIMIDVSGPFKAYTSTTLLQRPAV